MGRGGRGGSGWDAAAAALQLEKTSAAAPRAIRRGNGGGECLRCFHAVIFAGRDPEMLCVMCFFLTPSVPPREATKRRRGVRCGEVLTMGESPLAVGGAEDVLRL